MWGIKRRKELLRLGVNLMRNKPTTSSEFFFMLLEMCVWILILSYSFCRTTESHEHSSLMLVEEEGKENNRRCAHQQFIARQWACARHRYILETLYYLLLWHESCCFNLIHTIFYSLLLFNDKTGCEYVYTCLTSNVFFLIDEENKRRWWRRRKKKKDPQKVSRLRTMQTHTHIYIYLSTRRTKKKKKRVSWSD